MSIVWRKTKASPVLPMNEEMPAMHGLCRISQVVLLQDSHAFDEHVIDWCSLAFHEEGVELGLELPRELRHCSYGVGADANNVCANNSQRLSASIDRQT